MKYQLFGASWCNPCKLTKKHLMDKGVLFEKGEPEIEGDVVFEYIDIETHSELAKANNIRGIPTAIAEDGTRVSQSAVIMALVK